LRQPLISREYYPLKTVDTFIVTFYSDLDILSRVLQRLSEAVKACSNASFRVTLVDNSHGRAENYFEKLQALVLKSSLTIDLQKSSGNLGFGRANNLAFEVASKKEPSADYILVLNPDAFLSLNSLNQALEKMSNRPEIGVLLPRFKSESGQDLYLAKRYPNLWVLFLRGFAPAWMKKLFRVSIDAYDLKDKPSDQAHLETVVGSGACFLMRKNIWVSLGGFDPRFFLYFEDFDLTYRANKITQVVYEPSIEVVHLGGHTAKKGSAHIKYFIKSAGQFFNKNGWKFF
jgi:GT2 family glycosyltransferase